MIKCYHCRGDGRDPYNDYLLVCPVYMGDAEIDDLDDDEDLQALMDRDMED